jgi:hypothetical protein
LYQAETSSERGVTPSSLFFAALIDCSTGRTRDGPGRLAGGRH